MLRSLGDVDIHLVTDIDTAFECARWASAHRRLAIDSESTGLSPETDDVRLLQLGDANTAYAIPLEGVVNPDSRYAPSDNSGAAQLTRGRPEHGWGGFAQDLLRRMASDPDMSLVGHNSSFDHSMVKHTLDVDLPRTRFDDTRLMAHVLDSTGSLGLKQLATKHVDPNAALGQEILNDALGKKSGWTWATVPIGFKPYWFYGGLDTILTYRLDDVLKPRVMSEAPRSYELELAVSWPYEDMERKGVRLDRPYTINLLDGFDKHVRQLDDWVTSNYRVRAGSDTQVIEVLLREGVDLVKKTSSGARYSLDKEVISTLEHPLAKAVLARRQALKNAGYLRAYLGFAGDDDIIHPSINSIGGTDKSQYDSGGSGSGVRTGRSSMSDPNLQNVPTRTKEGAMIRKCFVPRAGNTWIKVDADQIESRVLAHLSRDPGLIQAFKDDGDFFVNLAKKMYEEPEFEKSDPRRQLIKNACVPLDTMILTKRGWLTHAQVTTDDYTLGFDTSTEYVRWTRITAVHHYADAPVVSLGNAYRNFTTTPDHRWIARHGRHDKLKWTTTAKHTHTEDRIILSAYANIGTHTISDLEASILGWILTDGRIVRGTYVGAPSQGHNGWKVKCSGYIYQKKQKNIRIIDTLLEGISHTRTTQTKEAHSTVVWSIDPAWIRSLLDRTGIEDKHTYDAWQVAFLLTPRQRELMLESMWSANSGFTGLLDDPQTELTVALGYLNGNFARVYEREPDGIGWQQNTCAQVNLQKPWMTGQKTIIEDLGTQPVWCVSTELGTWTMRQGRTPVLTGNSYAKAYGSGIEKFAKTANIDFDHASSFMRTYDTMFAGVPTFIRQVEAIARERFHTEGAAYVRSPLTGRKHHAEMRKLYPIVNYMIQGMAGELLKLKIVEADNAGLGPYMLFPVHDEIDLDVPTELVPSVLETVMDTMNDDKLMSVPLTWSADIGDSWGTCK